MSRIVIVGSSGEGIALAGLAAHAGFSVRLLEPDRFSAERCAVFLAQIGGDAVQVTGDSDCLSHAEFVIEALDAALPERLEWHRKVAVRLPLGTVFLSAGRDVALKSACNTCIGFHVATPVHMRQLAEITPSRRGDVAPAVDLARGLGRVAVVTPRNGAMVSAVLERALWATLEDLQIRGAIPHEIDEALVAGGWGMGPHEAQDLIGTEIAYADRRKRGDRSQCIADRMVEEGRLGKKVGVGWYRYPGGGGAVIDPLIEDLIREEAHFAGVAQRSFTADDVVQAVGSALSDAGGKLMESPVETLEMVAFHGLGVPHGFIDWGDHKGARSHPGRNSI